MAERPPRLLSLIAAAPRRLSPVEFAVLGLVAGAVALIVTLARRFEAPFAASVPIDLGLSALPRYAALSLARGVAALLISYLFAFAFGWTAARFRAAERVLLPLLDILQSVPVLGFLPGLVLGLVALAPHRSAGLELAAILMIFTAQAWNLALGFYESLRGIPASLREACALSRWGAWRVFRRLELPASAHVLVWNGMLSMAGGWFFLMITEAFQLGRRDFRLPGIGAYMSVAVERGDARATLAALVAMALMIVATDRLLWRPLAGWAEKFRLDEAAGGASAAEQPTAAAGAANARLGSAVFLLGLMALAGYGVWRLGSLLAPLRVADWAHILLSAMLTFFRVLAAVGIATLWTLPAGILVGRSKRLQRAAQPVIQLLASFPAPMLFPIVVLLLVRAGIGLGLGSIVLLVLSAQWYVLFNVIATVGAMPEQLDEAARSFRFPRALRWRDLYLPAAFPGLVTGWITAAGGAWNASIVAEFVHLGREPLSTTGLGSLISLATQHGNFPLLAGGVATMSIVVVAWNRLVWRRLATVAATRFSLST